MNKLILSLGANVGDRLISLKKTLQKLIDNKLLKVTGISSIYLTSPVDYLSQNDFYNMCVQLETNINPEDFHALIKSIEIKISNKIYLQIKNNYNTKPQKTINKGPRIIDIDIILYGDRVINKNNLIIPHANYQNRLFVLYPLLEIDSHLSDPQSGKKISSYLQDNNFDNQVIRKLTKRLDFTHLNNGVKIQTTTKNIKRTSNGKSN